jgi:hypothetical protein
VVIAAVSSAGAGAPEGGIGWDIVGTLFVVIRGEEFFDSNVKEFLECDTALG